MIPLLKNQTYSIGVDIGDDNLKVAQLGSNGNGISLIDGGRRNRPEDIKPGSSDWQRWAIDAIQQLTMTRKFRGKDVVAAIPTSEVFIDHIRIQKTNGEKLPDLIFSKIKQKLPFEPIRENTMIQYIPAENDNFLVIAVERKIIDRHLAIYEEAGLNIKSIAVWPIALANSYAKFFGRRKDDIKAIVMLICIESNCTNVVISRHKNLLFARSIPIGAENLDGENTITRLVLELTSCKRHFSSMHRNARIERLVFLSGRAVETDVYTAIAKQLEMPAQIGDCLAAVEINNPSRLGIDRRTDGLIETALQKNKRVNWATAFGLSLS